LNYIHSEIMWLKEKRKALPMHTRARTIRVALGLLLAVPAAARAQWQLLDPPTTADLRGIDNVGGGVAWASGTNGTVVRTEDGGYMWQHCSTPPGAEKLDFRGIQAFDENTAIVMSSGPGDQSRLYKTTDGCQSWTLLFTNPDPTGFWDALQAADSKQMILFGDPVNGAFRIKETWDGGQTWTDDKSQPALKGEGAFAASNSSLSVQWVDGVAVFGTGSPTGARLFTQCDPCTKRVENWNPRPMPMFARGEAAGIFSIAQSDWKHLLAVGGDYKRPDDSKGTAAYSHDGGQHWQAVQVPPHGYRSAVAYDKEKKTWITVGPNGTDISTDDGRTWTPLHPSTAEHDTSDADRHWNALSLPYVVGPHGRVGKLRDDALPEPEKTKQPKP
jgi:photosystem II stability/assembly factor-like uncharacterized protein